ncbi:MAG: iron ABC transporter permease [Planctomycetes bacterium]|nr:iron ABC transporter permease [Planctomycetota bacterium]
MNKLLLFFILLGLLVLTFFISLAIGSGNVPWSDFWRILFNPDNLDPLSTIIWQIRFPRLIAALLIGAGLAAVGCAFQGILRNPLAEPYTLGISGGAALGGTVAIIFISKFNLPGWVTTIGLPLAALVGALLSLFLVYLIASRLYFSVTGLILGGVLLSFIFSSLVLLIMTLAQPDEVKSTLLWMAGNLSMVQPDLLKISSVFIIPGIIILFIFGRDLDVITLGDEKAQHLGIKIIQIRQFLFVISSLIVAFCVANAGMIAFVGLLIPHLMRILMGPKHQPLIWGSALAGGIFLMLADTVARTVLTRTSFGQGVELPVGVITGILGGIFFLAFLLRRKNNVIN